MGQTFTARFSQDWTVPPERLEMLQESSVLSVLFVASPKYVPGEKNWRNDLCNCIFGSVFWKILKFFCKLGCWLLNCMCKWDTISGMFGCIWIFRNIFTGNLFLAKKVSPVSRSCEGHMLQVLRGKDTHPTTKSMDVMDVHVKQVYTSWIWYYWLIHVV